MDLEYEPREWPRIRPLCTQEVQHAGYDEYFARVQEGWAKVEHRLREMDEGHAKRDIYVPDAKDVAGIHKVLFRGTYESAGEFRTEEEARAPRGDFRIREDFEGRPAYPTQIEAELDNLRNKESLGLFAQVRTDAQAVQAIAFHHAKLMRIHPFRDGNTRVALLITDHQVERLLGHPCPE